MEDTAEMKELLWSCDGYSGWVGNPTEGCGCWYGGCRGWGENKKKSHCPTPSPGSPLHTNIEPADGFAKLAYNFAIELAKQQ